MRAVFAVGLLVLSVASVVLLATSPPAAPSDRAAVVWVSDENPLRQEQIARFNLLRPDRYVLLDPNNGGLEKIIVQTLAGVGPDVFDCYTPYDLMAFERAGIVEDIRPDLARRGVDPVAQTFAAGAPFFTVDGKVYGVLANVGADGLWYHRDLLDAAGVRFPDGGWRWSEFIPLAQRLTVRDAAERVQQYGFYFSWDQWADFFAVFGAKVFSEDGTEVLLDSAAAKEAVGLMRDLVYRYRVSPSPVEEASMASQGGWGSGGLNYLLAKRVAVALGGRWWLATLRKEKGLRLGVAETPHAYVREFYAAGRSTLLARGAPHREAALDFLAFMGGADYNRLINLQADAMSPVRRYVEEPAFLRNPDHPEEDYNHVWGTIMERAVAAPVCPFLDGGEVYRAIGSQLDLVKAGAKSPDDAMDDAARRLRTSLARALEESPALREEYDRRVAARKGARR
ncbi:MAG: extracellular solute-binding protein [Fimbriimonadaceae bacterium]|nr:extracellular solute-binding protein [Fimbriimonadaceae bacterium]